MNSKSATPIVIIISLLLLGGLAYGLWSQQQNDSNLAMSPSPDSAMTVEPSLSPQQSDLSTDPSSQTDALRMGGNSYSDPQGAYVFLYPNDYTQDSEGNGQHIRVYKRGESQRPQSEMSDGVIMVFETINLNGQSLEAWVDAQIQSSTANGLAELTVPKRPIVVNSYQGFSYSMSGLGESSHLVLQKDARSTQAVSITTLVADPQQKGYQAEVDAILATLEILK